MKEIFTPAEVRIDKSVNFNLSELKVMYDDSSQ